MPHCDEETLSLLALGEPAPVAVREHLATCAHCSAELSTLRSVVTAARDVAPEPLRVAPPARVWAQIAAATGVETAPRPYEVLRHAEPSPHLADPAPSLPTTPAPTETGPAEGGSAEGGSAPFGDVVALRRQPLWRRPDRPMLLLAAACLVIGLIAGGIGTRLLTGPSPGPAPAAKVVAATSLAGLALAPAAAGQADVVSTPTGRQLDLDVQKLGIPDGFYEVWLIDPTVTKMVPIGVLSGSQGRFSLPAGVNLNSYPLVDISIQPLNGNPKHSGRSVLRGTLKS